MASIFGHALIGIGLGQLFTRKTTAKILLLCVICTIIPDADVIAFSFGIPYAHPLGHRGFSHSIVFALLLGVVVKFLFFRKVAFSSRQGLILISLFFLSTISHGVLDACTNGGQGVGFFIPLDNTRYFFPWRPIQVSPIGAANFFSEWGWRVIKSEIVWIGIPGILMISIGMLIRRKR